MATASVAHTFKGKRVFVTGHTGFKGSWLCLMLSALGARITGYALPPENPSFYNLLKIDALMEESHLHDINSAKALARAIHDFSPDAVFHLAAQPLVLPALERPVETFATNIMGTVHVLDALRELKKPVAAVIVTSDKCYRNEESKRPYVETDRLGGSDPYTASKACAELVTAAYREAYFRDSFTRVATARGGNVLGGGDFGAHRLVPDLYRAVSAGKPLTLRYPDAVRPWQHVLDVLWGYLTLGAHLLDDKRFEGEYNFANAHAPAMKVKEVVQSMLTLWGKGETMVKVGNARHRETGMLLIDPGKAERVLSWKSRMDNDAMLKATAEWYALLLSGDASLAAYTKKQLNTYLEAA